jgi:tetratricopeptide (TPR) repeat protein
VALLRLALASLLLAAAARAEGGHEAIAIHEALEKSGAARRADAEVELARALDRLGLTYSAFSMYGEILATGPTHPHYLDAVAGAVAAADRMGDEVLAPNVLARAYDDSWSRLPPAVAGRANTLVALLAYRAGKYDDADAALRRVPEAAMTPQARYLSGLVQQRKDPEAALKSFRAVLPGADEPLKELTDLAIGRTLYALKRFEEASQAYAQLPRFSRHWDEALFEGAYADLQAGDAGAALGKLHSLHSPHLSDEFAPESLNLAAIIYHQRCLYPSVRGILARFDRDYLPIRDRLRTLVQAKLSVDDQFRLLDARDDRLPKPLKKHLLKNERIAGMLAFIGRLDAEAARIRGDGELTRSALGRELIERIDAQRTQMAQLGGKFVEGRLRDLLRTLEMLDADKEIIGFETTKGEKEMLEKRFDPKTQLAAQSLGRPRMPQGGYEYWPFDGEYWPDEIGWYRYTIKDACPAKEAQP